jgi:hypothetical protein
LELIVDGFDLVSGLLLLLFVIDLFELNGLNRLFCSSIFVLLLLLLKLLFVSFSFKLLLLLFSFVSKLLKLFPLAVSIFVELLLFELVAEFSLFVLAMPLFDSYLRLFDDDADEEDAF